MVVKLIVLAEDYYSLLGLSKGATDKEIKSAFRKLAVKYHPDKNKDPDAEKKFVKIAEGKKLHNFNSTIKYE